MALSGARGLRDRLTEVQVAVVVALGTILLGAPVGLVWAHVSPRVEVVIAAGQFQFTDPTSPGFVAADATFLLLAALAGIVSGLVALLLGRRHGPGLAVGLAVGGLLAAEVARRTGQLVGADDARVLVESGRDGVVELAVRLRARSAQVAWAVAALAVLLLATLLDRDEATDDAPSRRSWS